MQENSKKLKLSPDVQTLLNVLLEESQCSINSNNGSTDETKEDISENLKRSIVSALSKKQCTETLCTHAMFYVLPAHRKLKHHLPK